MHNSVQVCSNLWKLHTCRYTTTKKANFFQRSLWINFRNTNIMYYGILTKCWSSHEVIDRFPISGKTSLAVIHHNTDSSSCSYFSTKVRLPWLAEFALSALCLVAWNNMISRLHFCDTFTDTLHNSTSMTFRLSLIMNTKKQWQKIHPFIKAHTLQLHGQEYMGKDLQGPVTSWIMKVKFQAHRKNLETLYRSRVMTILSAIVQVGQISNVVTPFGMVQHGQASMWIHTALPDHNPHLILHDNWQHSFGPNRQLASSLNHVHRCLLPRVKRIITTLLVSSLKR